MFTTDRTMTRAEYQARRRAPRANAHYWNTVAYYPPLGTERKQFIELRLAIPEPHPDVDANARRKHTRSRRNAVLAHIRNRRADAAADAWIAANLVKLEAINASRRAA